MTEEETKIERGRERERDQDSEIRREAGDEVR
jgi:hypothetical protein